MSAGERELRDVIERFWDRYEAKDYDALEALMAPDCQSVMPGGEVFNGPGEVIPLLRGYAERFPDMHTEILSSVESGDTIAVELRVQATHTGTFQAPNGPVPPTGKQVVWRAVDYITVAEGKLQTWHSYYDQLSVMAQLGLLPEGATA